MNNMYELINQDSANRIIEIIENTALYKPIELKIGKYEIHASYVGETIKLYDDLNKISFLNSKEEIDVLNRNNKFYNLFLNVGQWKLDTRLHHAHITVGSSGIHQYCFQIELSPSVESKDYIYILKNVTNLAGEGTIQRLFSRSISKEEKYERLGLFLQEFGNETITVNEKEWVVVSKIKKDELYKDDEDVTTKIFYDLMYNTLRAMLIVESISGKI